MLFLPCYETRLQLLCLIWGPVLNSIFLVDYRGCDLKDQIFCEFEPLHPAGTQEIIKDGHQENNECYN